MIAGRPEHRASERRGVRELDRSASGTPGGVDPPVWGPRRAIAQRGGTPRDQECDLDPSISRRSRSQIWERTAVLSEQLDRSRTELPGQTEPQLHAVWIRAATPVFMRVTNPGQPVVNLAAEVGRPATVGLFHRHGG